MANNKWLLLAAFGGQDAEFRVIAKGREPCGMVSLSTVIGRSRYMPDVRALAARVARSGQPGQAWSHDGQRQVVGYPLADASGHVNGVFTWTGEWHETPPARDPAGAWTFNLTTGWATASQDLPWSRCPPWTGRE
jgi:hypothetical protein